MLAIVLADHVDSLTSNPLVTSWTLQGLGFSDASDVFVSLSGFVFGYLYGERIQSGDLQLWRRIAKRTLVIYCAFLMCSAFLGLINIKVDGLDWELQIECWRSNLLLSWHDSNTAILSLFVVLVPWTYSLYFVFRRRSVASMLGVSSLLYITAQICGPVLPSGWLFQPLAWQLPMFIASILGKRYRTLGDGFIPRVRWLFVAAVLVLLAALFIKKFWGASGALPGHSIFPHILVSKATWGPIRAFHHWLLMYVVLCIFPLDSCVWSAELLRPLRICGRHPLLLYCTGVLVSRIGQVLLQYAGADDFTKIIFLVDALAILFSLAFFLDRIRAD